MDKLNEIKEKIRTHNPEFTDELIDLMCESILFKIRNNFEEITTKCSNLSIKK